ncbi:hypothetical protein ABZY90_21750 [Streptomyces sp. NPDC006422]|uniref:hypothetical protein n=1 Tax=unclassified Streptomyces TaxID=2593676 RepID=UPI0033A3E9CD
MRRRQLHLTVLAFGSIATVLALAGCDSSGSSDSGDTKAGSVPRTSTAPKLASTTDQSLPIEAYMYTKDQTQQLDNARVVLRRECMRRFGFPYEDQKAQNTFQPKSIAQFRYGVTDADDAAVHGYKPAGSERKVVKPAPVKMAPAATTALTGTQDAKVKPGSAQAKGGQRINGHKVPAGGCIGEADRKLGATSSQDFGDAPVVVRVNSDSWAKSYNDKRVRAVFTKWSACMKDKGYAYADPMKANDDRQWQKTATATPREQQVAAADVACKHKYNVLGVWYSVDVAYQKQMIEQNAEALNDVRKQIDKRLKLAADIA